METRQTRGHIRQWDEAGAMWLTLGVGLEFSCELALVVDIIINQRLDQRHHTLLHSTGENHAGLAILAIRPP